MKREEIIKILEEEFPKSTALDEDFVGLQVEGKNEIKNIMVCLDLTLDVMSQAFTKKIDLIITHHPLFFGDKNILLEKDPFLRAKYKLLKDNKINVFVIHTNADFNDNSIAFNLGIIFNIKDVKQLINNSGVEAELINPMSLNEISQILKNQLKIEYDFRDNVNNNDHYFSNIVIASGAAGDLIFEHQHIKPKSLFIIGEIKHHHWIFASENNIQILEIGHFSEIIFKEIISIYLKEHNISVILADEINKYKSI